MYVWLMDICVKESYILFNFTSFTILFMRSFMFNCEVLMIMLRQYFRFSTHSTVAAMLSMNQDGGFRIIKRQSSFASAE